MKRILAMFLMMLLIMPLMMSPQKAEAATGAGWYFTYEEFVETKGDITGGFMGGGGYTDRNEATYEGGSVNTIHTSTKRYNNADNGFICGSAQDIVWRNDPPSFILADTEYTFEIKNTETFSDGWNANSIYVDFAVSVDKEPSENEYFGSSSVFGYVEADGVQHPLTCTNSAGRFDGQRGYFRISGNGFPNGSEMRFHYVWRDNDPGTMPGAASTGSKAGSGVTSDQTTYAPGDEISITVTGLTDTQKQNGTIALHKPGTSHTTWIDWDYLKSLTNGVWTIDAPTSAGDYEIRVYSQYGDGNSVIYTCIFTVSDKEYHVSDKQDMTLYRDNVYSEPISVGAKFNWPKQSGGLGWRLYRSTTSGKQGISVTDFYITSTDFIDVNVDANTTYYYVLREVLAEANPFQGIEEKLGPASAEMKVTTPSTILGGNASDAKGEKQFILMTLDDPMMTVNGAVEEIDPGRGTTPVIVNSRTLVPIRAIVEAMGGTIDWNAATQTVGIDYNARRVKMTIDSKSMSVNGAQQTIDVAPRAINSRTMLPVRFVSDALGISIDWLNSTKQIVIVYIN